MPDQADKSFVENAENELDVKFPDSYRTKMLRVNGGHVYLPNQCFELHPLYNSKDIKRTCVNVVYATKKAHEQYSVPSNLIVLGNDGNSNLLVYKIDGNGELDPAVYLFDHETRDVTFITGDFQELELEDSQGRAYIRNLLPIFMFRVSLLAALCNPLVYWLSKSDIFSGTGVGGIILSTIIFGIVVYGAILISLISLILAAIYTIADKEGDNTLLHAFFIGISPLAIAIFLDL